MAIKFGFYNYSVFFAALSPLFISVYLLLSSLFQGNIRGIVFLIGNAVASLFGMGVKNAVKRPRGKLKYLDKYNTASDPSTLPPAHDFCDVFEPAMQSLKHYGMPSSHAVFYGYLLTYLQLGIQSNPNKPGIPFFIFLSILGGLDLFFRATSRCDSGLDIFAGLIVGGFVGAAWWFFVRYAWPDGEKVVYFAKDDINTEKCKLGKQKFVCKKN